MITWCTGWLWQWVWFRFLVLRWVAAGWWGGSWLAVNTPFMFVLRAKLDLIPGQGELVASIDNLLKGHDRHVR